MSGDQAAVAALRNTYRQEHSLFRSFDPSAREKLHQCCITVERSRLVDVNTDIENIIEKHSGGLGYSADDAVTTQVTDAAEAITLSS